VKRDVLVLTFAMLFPGVMAWIYFIGLAGEEQGSNLGLQLTASAGKVFQFGFPLAYLWLVDRDQLRWTTPSLRGLTLGLGFGLLVFAGILGLYPILWSYTPFLEKAPAKVHGLMQQFGLATPAKFILMATFVSLIHSLLEEYYWRWFIFGRLRRHVPVAVALILSSAAFMLHHICVLYVYLPGQFWTAVVPFSICVGVGGAFWAWLYQQTESLYAIWSSHILADIAIMQVGYDLMSKYWR
jgi:membrane protease YdiL (CAAX protease family)